MSSGVACYPPPPLFPLFPLNPLPLPRFHPLVTTSIKPPPNAYVLRCPNRYGRSLGSGPTCQLAEELAADGVELGGVMLQSPLASAFRVAFNFRFTMPGDLFPNIDRAKNIACPMFIIHGTRCGWAICSW